MSTRFSVSVIMPIYNEEEIVVNAMFQTYEALQNSHCDFELIVVDDGSIDNSVALIMNFVEQKINCKLIKKQSNEGFGAAVRAGFSIAQKEYLLCVPADSPMDEKTLKLFVEHYKKADVLVSYREERLGYTVWMRLNSAVFHHLITWLFGMKLKDYNWIHLYHRKIFEQGQIHIEYDGIFMLAEILIKAKRKGFTVFEFPVQQRQRLTGIASASKLVNVLKTTRDVFKFRLLG
jgi:undecaprenyl-phosphate 4-deoxy-4-formamido-L-arabinose transferase